MTIEEERKELERLKRNIRKRELEEYRRALYNIDMVNGFVNFGAMANQDYNLLVPEQVRIMNDFVRENESINLIGEGHDEDALEFESYPKHCVIDTPEALFIPELQGYEELPNTRVYRKNSINGMLNDQVRRDISSMKNLEEAVFMGVCEDLCVMDFVRTYARYLDQINKKVQLFVVGNTVDTFDAPGHSREEWKRIARLVMEQAGVTYVRDYEELKDKEKVLGLRK